MINFEYFMWLLQDNEDLVNKINNMEQGFIPELVNSVCESVGTYYEFEDDGE